MTDEQFDKIKFHIGMEVYWNGNLKCLLYGVNFETRELQIMPYTSLSRHWVKAKNCEIKEE